MPAISRSPPAFPGVPIVVLIPEIPYRVEVVATHIDRLRRGGQPTAGDRLVASAFGVSAVDLVAAGRLDRMAAWQNRRVADVPLAVAITMPHCIDPDGALVRTVRGLGICLGDG